MTGQNDVCTQRLALQHRRTGRPLTCRVMLECSYYTNTGKNFCSGPFNWRQRRLAGGTRLGKDDEAHRGARLEDQRDRQRGQWGAGCYGGRRGTRRSYSGRRECILSVVPPKNKSYRLVSCNSENMIDQLIRRFDQSVGSLLRL